MAMEERETGGVEPGDRVEGLLERAAFVALQVAAVAVPLVVAPTILNSVIDLPKRLVLEAVLIICWAALVAGWMWRGRAALPAFPGGRALLLFLASALVSCGFAVNGWYAFDETTPLIALAFLAWAVVLGLDAEGVRRLAVPLLATGGALALYGILQYCGIDFLPWASSWGSRCFGTIGNPVFFAEYLAPLFVLATVLWLAEADEERKDLLVFIVLAMFLALLFSQTRSAWLGALAGLGVAALLLEGPVRGGREILARNRVWLLSLGGFVLAVVLTISSPLVFGKSALPLWERLSDMFNFKGWTVSHRIVLWRSGAVMLRSSPLFGVGPGHFRTHFPPVQARFRAAYLARDFHFAPKEMKAHNDYVQIAAETGVVGLGLWLWLLTVIIRSGLAATRACTAPGDAALATGMLGGLAALMVDACFNFPFQILPAALVFWIFAASLALLCPTGGGIELRLPFQLMSRSPAVKRAVLGGLGFLAVGAVAWIAVPAVMADRAYSRGEFYMASRMWEMSQLFYDRALSLRPRDALTHYQMGVALERGSAFDWSGRSWDRAMFHYLEARRLGLNDELLYGQMAILAEKKGNYASAVRMSDLALAIYPDRPDYLANQAYWLSVREERLNEALDFARRAVKSSPDHPLFVWTEGLVLEKMGRRSEALRMLLRARDKLRFIMNPELFGPDLKKDIDRLSRR